MNPFRRNNSQESSTKKRSIFNRHRTKTNSSISEHPPLSSFDACVEAADALAAQSSRQTYALVTEHRHDPKINEEDSLPNVSVLVSPDGALLFKSNTTDNVKYSWTASHHPTTGNDEEYESAILTGDDLTPQGDYDSNGFSARGWDADAASNALKASQGVLKCMESFVEGVAWRQKENGVAAARRCGDLVHGLEKIKANMDGGRVGPLLAHGSSLANALVEIEQYYSSCAKSSSERWREACCNDHPPPSLFRRGIDGQPGDDVTDKTVNGKKAINESLIKGFVPRVKYAVMKAEKRIYDREFVLSGIQNKVSEAENNLMKQKERSFQQWQRVKDENKSIDEIVDRQVKTHNELMKKLRQEKDVARLIPNAADDTMSDNDLWEMVKDIDSMEEFENTRYSKQITRQEVDAQSIAIAEAEKELAGIPISRVDIENESDIRELRRVALEADDLVEDAAGSLLHIMSKLDTTKRSARVAAETCLLSECNAAHQCLRSILEIERANLQEQLEKLEKCEAAVNAVNIRNDIDNYICRDKTFTGGMSRSGDNDDGGVASALAVLNSHNDDYVDVSRANITRPNFFKGWSENDEVEDDEIEPDFFKMVIQLLLAKKSNQTSEADISAKQKKLQIALSDLSSVLSERSQQGGTARQAILYELNSMRSINTVIEEKANFEGLCMLMNSFLTGCGRESIDVSNAKLLMILSQTFYLVDKANGADKSDRTTRIYVKNRISSHEIWTDDYFWDQALYQCVAESLKKSGVLLNYIKPKEGDLTSAGESQNQIKWHDLSHKEYPDAAAQVHSVVFAQLGTLSHSMLELGCGILRAGSFVRRLSIRYQLPLSLRITLIQHLTNKDSKDE